MFVGPRVLRIAGLNSGVLGALAKEVWRLLCCGDAPPKHGLESRTEVASQRLAIIFQTLHDHEYTLRGMMWADNHSLFSDTVRAELMTEMRVAKFFTN